MIGTVVATPTQNMSMFGAVYHKTATFTCLPISGDAGSGERQQKIAHHPW